MTDSATGARLAGKRAFVTGAAGDGLGRAIALAFAREGAEVAIFDVRPTEETRALVTAGGGRCWAGQLDLAEPETVIGALDRAAADLGPPDVMVNAAATIDRTPFLEITLEQWDRVHGVNLRGTFVAAQWAARSMVKRGHGGSIINIASVGAVRATREQAHYCASKGGVLMLTKVMAVELAPHGIRVNAISPGTFETDINRHLLGDPAFRAMRSEPTPLKRVGTPAEITGMAVLLASDEASFITGANMLVDGGNTA
jgi:NAD(P)-dependent dehydrogenase (short-subunit alcohol dehydrogenase family)